MPNIAPVVDIKSPLNARVSDTVRVNTKSDNSQYMLSSSALADGGYIIFWRSYHGDDGIYFQRYNSSGIPIGNETPLIGAQGGTWTRAFGLADGSYVLTWLTYIDFEQWVVNSQKFDSSGRPVGDEMIVGHSVSTEPLLPPALPLTNGGFLMTWDSGADQLVQLFDASGEAQGEPVVVLSPNGWFGSFSIAPLADGGYVIAYTQGDDLYTQRLDASFQNAGARTLISDNLDIYSDVIGLLGGGYVVVWEGASASADGRFDIYAQRFDALGVARHDPVRINTTTAGDQMNPTTVALKGGEYLVTWASENGAHGTYAQRFDASGNPIGGEFLITGHTVRARVTALADGSFVAMWTLPYETGAGLYAEHFDDVFLAQEQQALDLRGTMHVADADAGSNAVTATLSVSYGVLTVAPGTAAVAVKGSGTGTVTITGSVTQINQLLAAGSNGTVTFTPDGDAPPPEAALTLTVNDGFTGTGGAQTGTDVARINIKAVDDPPVARSDVIIGSEGIVVTGNVFRDNGSGEDTDPDNDLVVYRVNGSTVDVGKWITLQSGASLRVNADGSFEYDQEGIFNYLPDYHQSGAQNPVETDSFTYSFWTGMTVKVILSIAGADSPGDELQGSVYDDLLRAGIGADTLNGGQGNDILDGGTGADTLIGGLGNDTYVVDNARDLVVEHADEGRDTVEASLSFSLAGQYVEILKLTGSAAINGIGNNQANTLTGNTAANLLNGAGGADTMNGGAGNDRYIVDNVGDTVTESSAAGGTDRVDSAVSFILGTNVENLMLTGSATIHGTGNGLSNTIIGNSAGNILDGRAGADTLEGKGGNDRYIIDNIGDKILELANEGIDTAETSISFSLAGQYVETLRLVGLNAINGTGNNQVNSIYGNAAANVIDAAGGDDKLYGGAGKDTLIGGTGADRFIFDSALNGSTNVDKIVDFSVAYDSFYLDRTVFKGVATGVVATGAFVNGTAALDAADRILYDKANGNIFYDADGTGAGAAVLFASVAAGTVLTNADFIGF